MPTTGTTTTEFSKERELEITTVGGNNLSISNEYRTRMPTAGTTTTDFSNECELKITTVGATIYRFPMCIEQEYQQPGLQQLIFKMIANSK